MKKILLLLVGLLAFVSIGAQQRVVKGRVTDRSDGSPIPAVTISTVDKAGLKHGGLTDADGYYNIQIPQESSILTFSFVGMKTVQVKIGNRKVINVVMEEDAVMTEEVVVTALGIKREAKALSYSTQGVDMESINDAKSSNIVSSLSGKIAGVQITPPGMNNGSARIVIRGNNSVTGNNQPLFVVDGMPIDNYDGENGNMDYGNGAADINPDDIENIEVLKGANASALYGSRAANGVILITTKKGGDKLKVDVNSNCMLQTLVEFPEYQNSYGVGTSFYIDNKNNPPLSNTNYRSWGSPMMGQPVIGLDGKLKPYLPEPDNVKDFYQTAATWTNSISVEGGNKKSQYRISYTNVHSSSVVEKFNIDNKSTFNIRLNNQFTNWLSLDSKVSYIDDRVTNRQYSKSDNKNPMNSYVHMARSTSLSELYTWKDANGSEIGTHRNFSNPYWIINENKNKDVKKRIIGAFVLKADIIDGLSLQAKAGIDTYNWNGYAFNNIGAMNDKDGQMQTFQQEMESFNIEGLLTYNKRFKDFSLMANAGLVMYSTKQTRYDQMVNSLLQPGLINISNSAESPKDTQRMSEKKINSLFGAVSLGYKDYLYLDITGRNDWSSTLPPKNNSYFYPSIGTSFIFSEAFKIGGFKL